MPKKKDNQSSEIIYSTALDLHQSEQLVTRENLERLTNLPKHIIDDRLKVLTDDGFMRRAERGVYIPVFKHRDARMISLTYLPDGSAKLDIGDDVLTLTPSEARTLGKLLMSEAMSVSALEAGNQFAMQNQLLQNKIEKLTKKIAQMEQNHQTQPQLTGLQS